MLLIDLPVKSKLEREALIEINALRKQHDMNALTRLRPGWRDTGSYEHCILGANLDHQPSIACLASSNNPTLRELECRFEHGELPHLQTDATRDLDPYEIPFPASQGERSS